MAPPGGPARAAPAPSLGVAASFASDPRSNASFALLEQNAHYYCAVPEGWAPPPPADAPYQIPRVCSVVMSTLLLALLTVLGCLAGLQRGERLEVAAPAPPRGVVAAPTITGSPSVRANLAAPPPPEAAAARVALRLDGRSLQVPLPLRPLDRAAAARGLAAIGVPPVLLLGNVFAHLSGALWGDFFAGLLAAFCATGIMYPVDTLKTRIQLGQPSLPAGGLAALYRGIPVALAKDCPAAAVYITTFEMAKAALLGSAGPDALPAAAFFLLLLLSGSIGDFFGSMFTLPMELILKPIQAGQRVPIGQVFKNHGVEGILGCWKSVLLRDMPMGALQLALFESLKPFVPLLHDAYHLPHFGAVMLLGAAAGAVSAFLTTPCDLLTSRMMTQHGAKEGVLQLAKSIWGTEGARGLFKGCLVRAYYFAPEACIFFGVFETLTSMAHPP